MNVKLKKACVNMLLWPSLVLKFIIERIKVAIGIANMKKVTELYFWLFSAKFKPVINFKIGIENQNKIRDIQLYEINFEVLFKPF